MARDVLTARGSRSHFALAAGAAVIVMLAASQVGLGVTGNAPLLAAEWPAPAFSSSPAATSAAVARPASLPVQVVLSQVVLAPAPMLPRTPVALPISFGRPIAPEDDAVSPPARWRHRGRTLRHVARQNADDALNDAGSSSAS